MSNQAEQAGDKTEAQVGLPPLNEFKGLTTEQMETKLQEAGAFDGIPAKVDNQNSDTAEETSEDTEQVDGEETDDTEGVTAEKTSESKEDKEDTQVDDDLKARFERLEKSNKELQAAFTRSRQELAELKKSPKTQEPVVGAEKSERVSKLAQLAKGDANAEKFVAAIEETIEERAKELAEKIVSEKVKPIEQRGIEASETQNLAVWQEKTSEFLNSPLKELTKELNEIIAERFVDNEEMIEAAKKDPNLFKEFQKELSFRHTEKVAELLRTSKSKKPGSETPRERNRTVKQTGVSGKSHSSLPQKGTMEDIAVFRAADPKAQEKYLREQGLIQY